MFNYLIPGCLPNSKYLFRKSLTQSMSENVETHAYCSTCGGYLSKVNRSSVTVQCSECDVEVNRNDMVKNGSAFSLYPSAGFFKKFDWLKHFYG